jgi:hypothetical protein
MEARGDLVWVSKISSTPIACDPTPITFWRRRKWVNCRIRCIRITLSHDALMTAPFSWEPFSDANFDIVISQLVLLANTILRTFVN